LKEKKQRGRESKLLDGTPITEKWGFGNHIDLTCIQK